MEYAPLKRIRIPARKTIVKIANLSDLHIGARATDLEHLQRDIAFIAKTPHCYAMLCGDVADFISHIDPRFDPTSIEQNVIAKLGTIWEWQCGKVAEILKPIKHKLICATTGNHDSNVTRRHMFNPTAQIWSKLGLDMRHCCSYQGIMSQRLVIERANHAFNVDFLLFHGRGAARTEGAKKNVLVDLMSSFTRWDVYFTGHAHTKDQHEIEEPAPNKDHTGARQVRRVGVRSGTYVKGCGDGFGTYSEKKAYRPNTLGCMGVQIRLAHGRDGNNEHADIRPWDIAAEPDIDDYWTQ